METKIEIAGPNDFLSLLATELGGYGFMTVIDSGTHRGISSEHYPLDKNSCAPCAPDYAPLWACAPDPSSLYGIAQTILTIVGSGGLITALSAFFKYRKKTFKMKTDKDSGFSFECENINPDEMKKILFEMNTYLQNHLEDDKKGLE